MKIEITYECYSTSNTQASSETDWFAVPVDREVILAKVKM